MPFFNSLERLAHDPVAHNLGLGEEPDRFFEIVGKGPLAREDFHIVTGKAVGLHETLHLPGRQLGQALPHLILPRIIDDEGNEVGFREIPVIVGLFLAPHGVCDALVDVEEPRFLDDFAAAADDSACLSISYSRALSMDLKELRFFSSARVPSSSSPFRRTDTFASHRKLPSSMFPSQISR